ncbi:MAG: glycosyltransferase family 2 protein, partial [Pseudobutyrivibrio sp.]|nr:glycosyltransferase family 2 protein [Pseudobutyrivibrio sp.]
MSSSAVSVIIPTYNREDSVVASILSVLDQTYSNLEVIVVDDGSTDATKEQVLSLNDSRITYHRIEENKGASNARNIGVKLAKNDIVAFNDSDDIWLPNKLELQMNYWNEHPEDILIYCAYEIETPDGMIRRPVPEDDHDTLSGDIFYYLLYRPAIGTPTMLMRKKLFTELGGFDTSCAAMEDWEFSIRVAREGKIGFIDEPLVLVEATGADRLSNTSSLKAKLAHYDTRCKVLKRYLEEIRIINQFDVYVG